MPDPKKPQKGDDKSSLEVYPEGNRETPPENLEAQKEKMEESKRGRADIRLERLGEKAKTRNLDLQTPDLINRINYSESLEKQEEGLDALKNVTIVLLSTLFYKNPEIEQTIDVDDFENFDRIYEKLILLDTKPSENAAIHKLKEMSGRKDTDITKYFKGEWPRLVQSARDARNNMKSLETADLRREKPQTKEKTKDSPTVSFFKNHPVISAGIIIGGVYGLYKILSAIKNVVSPAPSATATQSKETGGSFWKWATGIGAAILGLFGFGRLIGKEGVKNFFKDKLGWDISDSRIMQVITLLSQGEFKKAWEAAWEGVDENSDSHREMAEIISKEMGKEVSGQTLFELRNEHFDDFTSTTSQWMDAASTTAGEYLGMLGKPFLDSKKTNEEQIAVRGFLRKHEKRIRAMMTIREETTVDQVLKELIKKPKLSPVDQPGTRVASKEKPSSAPAAAVAAGATAVAGAERATTSPEIPEEKTAYSERDVLIKNLTPESKQERAVKNEELLKEKITFAQISEFMDKADENEQKLIKLLNNTDLKPDARKTADAKLRELLQQKETLNPLLSKHNAAYAAYVAALRENASEEKITERFADLIEAKELLEEQLDDMFKAEGWNVLATLAVSHSLKFATFVKRRWFPSTLAQENANYLFDKFIDRLRPSNLRKTLEGFRKIKIPPPDIATLTKRTTNLLAEMNKKEVEMHEMRSGEINLEQRDFQQLDRYEHAITEQERHLTNLFAEKQRALKEAIKTGKPTDALLAEIKQIGDEQVRLQFGAAKTCGNWYDRWKAAIKGKGTSLEQAEIYEQGVNKFRSFFRRTLVKQKETLGMGLTKVLVKRGKLVFLSAIIGGVGGAALKDEKTGTTEAFKQGALSAVPVVGTYLDFYSAFEGKEKITGRSLDTADRAVCALFGAASLATDALSVFGIGLAGKAALMALRASTGMGRAARVAKVLKASKDATTAAKGYKIAEQAGKWAFRVSLGTALGTSAYMMFSEKAELPISEDFKNEVLADMHLDVPEAAIEGAGQAEAT